MSFIDIDELLKQLRCGYGEEHYNKKIISLSLNEGIEMKFRLLCENCF